MVGNDLIGPSRDGDQFHYHWAARQCLALLSPTTDLVAVTIEGPSPSDATSNQNDSGENVIDVGLYFGDEDPNHAKQIHYIQLKHSTRHEQVPWTASGLKRTIAGFATRFSSLTDRCAEKDSCSRFRFTFTTNRPITPNLIEALNDLASNSAPRHPAIEQLLVDYSGLQRSLIGAFFSALKIEPGEPSLWNQRNLLSSELGSYLPEADADAPIQLKELVTRKATSEFEKDRGIRRQDVLRILKASEDLLRPAPNSIPSAEGTVQRQQEADVHAHVVTASTPVILHADAGFGKSVLAARLALSFPADTVAILYDCFGDGLYRSALHFRHRHRDALVQIANEISARGLCHPLVPTPHADASQYMRAFVHRLGQATRLITSRNPNALLVLIVDAADNAQMAAEEQQEASSFARDLIRTPMPTSVRLVFTCRSHRRHLLLPPPTVQNIEVRPFTIGETATYLRKVHAAATDTEVREFAFLSSFNPRVQALALSHDRSLGDTLRALGPAPTTVEKAIGGMLEAAIAKLRDQAGPKEANTITLICQGLAALRPLVPVSILAEVSGTSESAIRSFVLDFGRPLLLKGSSVHFVDEPAETWFRETYKPTAEGLAEFLKRLRPLASQSSYAAASLPQLLLQTGQIQELVALALSDDGLPTENPMARRDVELQRMTFALKACLQNKAFLPAAKLALKSGGETAGEQRQLNLIRDNTDLAAVLMAPDRIEDIVSRREIATDWMGSGHAYSAGLLSGREEYAAEASSQLRMAIEWLKSWSRLPQDERDDERVEDSDRVELTMAIHRLRSPEMAANFLRQWTSRRLSFSVGRSLGARYVDLGHRTLMDQLATAAGNDIWLLLGLAHAAASVGHGLPVPALKRLLRLLCSSKVKLEETKDWGMDWDVLHAVRSVVEIALRALPPDHQAWAQLIRRYLPATPPRHLADRWSGDKTEILRSYALEAALRGEALSLFAVAPPEVRKQLESKANHSYDQDTDTFLREVGGLLPWSVMIADITCGRPPTDIVARVRLALKETMSAESRSHGQDKSLRQSVAKEWVWIASRVQPQQVELEQELRTWIKDLSEPLWPQTITRMAYIAARCEHMQRLALELSVQTFNLLEPMREDAESRSASYINLARAIFPTSRKESQIYFDRAFEISSRVGDENLDRWAALLNLAEKAGDRARPKARTAYRLSRVAELTYEYVARDKYFDWERTVECLVSLCAASGIAILSRWRDRKFGSPSRLLPVAIYALVDDHRLPALTPIAMAGLSGWDRVKDLKRALASGHAYASPMIAQVGYRYLRLSTEGEKIEDLQELSKSTGLTFLGLQRLIAAKRSTEETEGRSRDSPTNSAIDSGVGSIDWAALFDGVDMNSPAQIDAARIRYRGLRQPFSADEFYREAIARIRIGDEPAFIQAVTSSPSFGIYDLRAFLEIVLASTPPALSTKHAIRDAVLNICRREPNRVKRKGWGTFLPFDQLAGMDIVADAEIVQAMLDGFLAQVEHHGSAERFKLVEPLADCLSRDEADEALNFGLDLLEPVLRPEDGDGIWRQELTPPESILAALAAYIWVGLGSPSVADRWEFSHVVRGVIELGWTGLLEAIVERARVDDPHPFVDAGLLFYSWHARQWLLFGLARGALENPKCMGGTVPLLEEWIAASHVLIRGLSAQTLRSLQKAGTYAGTVGAVNLPRQPPHTYRDWRNKEHTEDNGDVSTAAPDEERFYFGIDIGPYWFAPLGRAFGLSEEDIENRARRLLRQQMRWSGGGWASDARHKRRLFSDREASHSHGSLPRADDETAYHSFHAMMMVAAELLDLVPVGKRDDSPQNDYEEWISKYSLTRADEQWIADRRDPRPAFPGKAQTSFDREHWRWSVEASDLDGTLRADDGLLTLWGEWQGKDATYRETTSVQSVLVPKLRSESLLCALQTATELGRFHLPEAKEEDFDDPFGQHIPDLKGWVVDDRQTPQMDERDPWGEGVHFAGPRPSDEFIESLGLTRSSDGRSWSSSQGGHLRSEVWTHVQGYGRESEAVPGSRLSASSEFLRLLFDQFPQHQLIIRASIRRTLSGHRRNEEDSFSYPEPYVRYYRLGGDGVPQAL